MIYDDLDNDVADLDRLAIYDISISEETQIFQIGDTINLSFTLMKNGIPSDEEVELISTNTEIIAPVDNELKAIAEGNVDIIVQLKQYPAVQKIINVQVGVEQNEFSAYIKGPDSIKLSQKVKYYFIGTSLVSKDVTFSISDTKYAKIVKIIEDNNEENPVCCEVEANQKNLLTKNEPIILTATYLDKEYTKEISIIPLWQVILWQIILKKKYLAKDAFL